MNARATELIRLLHLSAHPEGGYFKEVYRSANMVKSPQSGQTRSAVTDIYFLLIAGQPSRFHRVSHDEIWNYYEGDPVEIIEITPDALDISRTVLGNLSGVARYKHCVKNCNWQAAYSTGGYSLAGCTVAPGFDYADFNLLKSDDPVRRSVQKKYPELTCLI